jgi:hypothetical protein
MFLKSTLAVNSYYLDLVWLSIFLTISCTTLPIRAKGNGLSKGKWKEDFVA